MKAIINKKQLKLGGSVMLLATLFILMSTENISAQSTAMDNPKIFKFALYSSLFLVVVFIGYMISVLRKAQFALKQSGHHIDFSFPVFREMARNSVVVTVCIVLIVITGIYFAINYAA